MLHVIRVTVTLQTYGEDFRASYEAGTSNGPSHKRGLLLLCQVAELTPIVDLYDQQ
jgi:hypothetical protein